MKKKRQQELNTKIQMHIDAEERNVFRDEHVRRYRIERRSRSVLLLALAAVLVYLAVIVLPSGMDSNNINLSVGWWSTVLQQNFSDLATLLGGEQPRYMQVVVCRYLIIALVGAALALAGCVYQGSLKNGLASPTTLGVQSGGVLGGSLYVLFFMPAGAAVSSYAERAASYQTMSIFSRYAESFWIMGGCFLAVIFVLAVARLAGRGKISTLALILTGMIFSSVAGGAVGLVRYWMLMYHTYDSRTYELRYMMMGTFSRVLTFRHLLLMGVPILIGIAIVLLLRTRLNLLVFGEDEARTMGLHVGRVRTLLLCVVTVLTAVVISFCGMIGFVGFIVPHAARRVVGPDFRWLVPASALLGALVMMVVYYVATVVNYADNINFMTSIIGGILFLIMLLHYRRNSNADWA